MIRGDRGGRSAAAVVEGARRAATWPQLRPRLGRGRFRRNCPRVPCTGNGMGTTSKPDQRIQVNPLRSYELGRFRARMSFDMLVEGFT